MLLFALKKAKFYRIISVPDCNSKRSKTRLICEEKEKYASSKKAGKNIYETVNTFTSQKVTFKINDWRNDLVLVLLSMAVRLRQVFVETVFFKFCTLNRQLSSPELSLINEIQSPEGTDKPAAFEEKSKLNPADIF